MTFNRDSPWVPIAFVLVGVAMILPEGGTRTAPLGVDVAAFGGAIVLLRYGCAWIDGDPLRRRQTWLGGIIRYGWCGLVPWVLQIVGRLDLR